MSDSATDYEFKMTDTLTPEQRKDDNERCYGVAIKECRRLHEINRCIAAQGILAKLYRDNMPRDIKNAHDCIAAHVARLSRNSNVK